MGKMLAALAALRYGSSLTDPEIWKNRQMLMNALMGLLGAAAYFVPVEMSHEDQKAVAGGLAVAVGLLNAYLTAATSEKVGLPTRDQASGEPGADEGSDGRDGNATGS